jgi:hypothetical protein
MIGVTENISHSMAKMCWSTIMPFFTYNSQIKCFQTCWYGHLLLFWYVELMPKVCSYLSVTIYFIIQATLYYWLQYT